VHKRILSAVKIVDFVSDIILRGRWCHVIVLNIHTPAGNNIIDVKYSYYEELKRVSDKSLNTK
jgi:hypothetical protein